MYMYESSHSASFHNVLLNFSVCLSVAVRLQEHDVRAAGDAGARNADRGAGVAAALVRRQRRRCVRGGPRSELRRADSTVSAAAGDGTMFAESP